MITIKGVRLDSVSVDLSGDESKVSASYALISETDRVVAKQSVGGYNDLKVALSPQVSKALNEFIAAYKADLHTLLGI